jgi:ribosomal protein S18 acetylase RimI-like enzyme
MSIRIVRWTEAALPPALSSLLAEAEVAGVEWLGHFVPEWQRRAFLEPGEGLFLALRGEVPVAMAVISKDGLVEDPDAGRLRYIFVSPEARRQGLAEAMVRLALERGDKRWRRVTLHTDNPVAAALYRRHGFSESTETARTTHVRLTAVQNKTAP